MSRVVAGSRIITNVAAAVGNPARVADDQLVERTRPAYVKSAAVAPKRSRAGHQHVVAAGGRRVAHDARTGSQHARVGNDQSIERAVVAYHVGAGVVGAEPTDNHHIGQ